MPGIIDLIGPVALFAVPVAAYVGLVFASQWLFVTRPQRRSRDRGLLREPARALSRRLESVNHRLVGAAVGLPLALFVWYLVYRHTLDRGGSAFAVAALALAGVAALGWFAQEALRLWPERIELRRAIDAQMITAQSLALLMRQAYWVFHDVHVAHHRINHLVLGTRGVFCVDTKARRVPRRWGWSGPKPRARAQVAFDGDQLHFPDWTESESLEDVAMQADWMQGWLADAAGEAESAVPTYGAIALPGWRVASSHWKRLLVFNPATPNMLVQGGASDARLDPTTAHQLVKHLQVHCREHAETRLRLHTRPWWQRLAQGARALLRRDRRGTGAA